jgi:hypothetical protein
MGAVFGGLGIRFRPRSRFSDALQVDDFSHAIRISPSPLEGKRPCP